MTYYNSKMHTPDGDKAKQTVLKLCVELHVPEGMGAKTQAMPMGQNAHEI